jgi:tape measure domain-containing protein
MNPAGSNLIFGIEGRDLSLNATLDALAQKVQAFGTQGATALGQVAQQQTQLAQATEKTAATVTNASNAWEKFWAKAGAIATGQLIYKGIADIESIVSKLTASIIELPAAYEQSQIGFKAMLDGNAQAADAMLAKLQQLANVTPFRFSEEQAAARTMLGLGESAQRVLPMLVDVDTAVAAVGKGEAEVQRVAAALAKMDAEGRVSARIMNEITLAGIPAWNMLAESMGLSVAQVRALSESGDLAASSFDKAFHEYTVKHWGNALTEQSQTFNGLISTAQDLFEQFSKTFGMPIIQELEPKLRGAVQALQDPRVLATITQWGQAAATFVGWIFEAVGGVAQLLGLPTPDLSKNLQSASDAVKQFAGDWSSTTGPIDKTKDQIATIRDKIAEARDKEAEMKAGYEQLIDPLQRRVTLLDRAYERENAMANLAVTQEKIDRDRALAQDIYSAQGREAAARLPEEAARLAEQKRAIQHEADKTGLQDQIYNLQQQEKAQAETAERLIRLAEATARALKEKSSTGGDGRGPQPPQPDSQSIKVAGDDIADRYAQVVGDKFAGQAPSLLDRLFGTPEQRQQAGQSLAADLLVGWGQSINAFDWGKWLDDSFQHSGGAGVAAGWGSALGASLHDGFIKFLQQQISLGDIKLGFGDHQIDLGDVTLGLGKQEPIGGITIGADGSLTVGGSGDRPVQGPPSPPTQTGGLLGPLGPSSPAMKVITGNYGPGSGLDVNPRHRAAGGPVDSGWYVVGEQGPEMLHAGGPGQVVPGGGHLTITIQTDRGDVLWRGAFERNRDFANKQIAISMASNP